MVCRTHPRHTFPREGRSAVKEEVIPREGRWALEEKVTGVFDPSPEPAEAGSQSRMDPWGH